MRILVDTNILIHREESEVVPKNLQALIRLLNENGAQVVIHPISITEINNDRQEERRQVKLSKLATYSQIENPPDFLTDQKFREMVGSASKRNDVNDCHLLYALYKNAVSFLITEDRGLITRGKRVDLSHLVLSIDEAYRHFVQFFDEPQISSLPFIKEEYAYNLDVKAPFFDSLRADYQDFGSWWAKIAEEGRKMWTYQTQDGVVSALLILKNENEALPTTPAIPQKERIKICTLKVGEVGSKIGELFVKMAIDLAVASSIDEVYVTCFAEKQASLVNLIETYGFSVSGKLQGGESVFIKRLTAPEDEVSSSEVNSRFYPSFYAKADVDKFIVPIMPQYHERLFTDYKGRSAKYSLLEFGGLLFPEGNTIKKAYLSNSGTRLIKKGDLLLFYRSHDHKAVTSIGSVVDIKYDVDSVDEVVSLVGSRSVYKESEVKDICSKKNCIIIFQHHFHLNNTVSMNNMIGDGFLNAPPQSITRITDMSFDSICKLGGLNECYIVN